MLKTKLALLAAVLVALFSFSSRPRAYTDLELTTDGSHFKVNGTTKFLPIISYFDAIHGNLTDIDSDFSDLKAYGFEGVRIFPNWYRYSGSPDGGTQYRAQDTLFDKDGNLRSGTLNKLLDILDLAKDHGPIVDLSFSVETVVDCPLDNCTSGTTALTFAEYENGLEAITTELANAGSAYKHVMFDLQNEYDGNKPNDLSSWNYSDMDTLAEAVHNIDPDRIVMASLGDSVGPSDAANDADLGELDVAVLHEPRNVNWGNGSDDRANTMHGITSLPVYFQESPRYRVGGSDTTCWWDHIQAAKSLYEAKVNGGVAAWNFHTRAGMNLNGTWNGQSIFDNFVSEETTFVTSSLASTLSCSGGGCPTADLTYDTSCPIGLPEPSSFARNLLERSYQQWLLPLDQYSSSASRRRAAGQPTVIRLR